MIGCMSDVGGILLTCVHNLLCSNDAHMVQFNYNFTHAWNSMHGNTQVFACNMPKFAVGLIIYTRQGMLFTRDETCHSRETFHLHETFLLHAWLAALGEQESTYTASHS